MATKRTFALTDRTSAFGLKRGVMIRLTCVIRGNSVLFTTNPNRAVIEHLTRQCPYGFSANLLQPRMRRLVISLDDLHQLPSLP